MLYPLSFSYPVETRIPARREAHSSLHERGESRRIGVAGAPLAPPPVVVVPAVPRRRASPIKSPKSHPSTVAFISRALEYGKWINATANTSDIADTIHVDVMCRANSNPHMCSCMAPSIRPMATKRAIR